MTEKRMESALRIVGRRSIKVFILKLVFVLMLCVPIALVANYLSDDLMDRLKNSVGRGKTQKGTKV